MKANGMLEVAQLEEVAAATVSPTPRSRIFSDITDPSNPIPRMYDGARYMPFRLRKEVIQSFTSNQTLTATSERVLTDATGGAITHILPAASTMTGECIYLQKIDVTFNIVHINRAGSDTIDGLTTTALNTYMEWILLRSTGTGWITLEWGYDGDKHAFTPTGSWAANTVHTGFWWRTGSLINFEGKVTLSGAPDSQNLSITIPVTLIAAKMAGSVGGKTVIGQVSYNDVSAGNTYLGCAMYSTTTAILLYIFGNVGGTSNFLSVINQANPVTMATGDTLYYSTTGLPVSGWRGSVAV